MVRKATDVHHALLIFPGLVGWLMPEQIVAKEDK
jgi:hypothetical protein